MVVAAIQNPNLAESTQNNTSFQHSGEINLEGLVEPSKTDVSSFHSTVQQSISQNTVSASASDAGFSSQSLTKSIMNVVEGIQTNRQEISEFASNINHLTTQEALRLQEATESLSLSVQFLSKGMAVATKAVDTIVHMQ